MNTESVEHVQCYKLYHINDNQQPPKHHLLKSNCSKSPANKTLNWMLIVDSIFVNGVILLEDNIVHCRVKYKKYFHLSEAKNTLNAM